MVAVMNTKPRTTWITALGALFLIWSLWALRQHTQAASVIGGSPPTLSHDSNGIPVTPPPAQSQAGDNSPSASLGNPAGLGTRPEIPAAHRVETDRPLILYAYFETENSRQNFEFFLRHGLHAGADFLFILNGDNKAEDILPKASNIRYIKRANDCYDLGAFAEVLLKNDLYKKYNRYITMNASIRGPFLPYWSTGCWSDMYLDRINEKVKVRSLYL